MFLLFSECLIKTVGPINSRAINKNKCTKNWIEVSDKAFYDAQKVFAVLKMTSRESRIETNWKKNSKIWNGLGSTFVQFSECKLHSFISLGFDKSKIPV